MASPHPTQTPWIVEFYRPAQRDQWNAFIQRSPNGHFMFLREYLDYHGTRFQDASLVVRTPDGRLRAVLPGHREGTTFWSHAGLTFGGMVTPRDMGIREAGEVFARVRAFLRAQGIQRMVYKPLPYIYHTFPTHEMEYHLLKAGGTLRDVRMTTVLCLTCEGSPRMPKGKRWSIRRGEKARLKVRRTDQIEAFWRLLEHVLWTRHRAHPTHTLEEIRLLMSRFPENIQLYVATQDGQVVAGALLYLTPTVVKTQYLANSPEGQQSGALDFLLASVIRQFRETRTYLDFGTSWDPNQQEINWGLAHWKESFGGRTVLEPTYELPLEPETA